MFVHKGKLLTLTTIFGAAILLPPSAMAIRGISMGHATVHTSSSANHIHYGYGRGWGWGRGWGRGWGGGYYDDAYVNPNAWGSGVYQGGMTTSNSLDIYNREHDAQMSQMSAASCIHTYSWPESTPATPVSAYLAPSKSPAVAGKTCQINPAGAPRVASRSSY